MATLPNFGSHWLDPIIRQQAAHYGKTVEEFTDMVDGAARTQEKIELGELTEEEARGVAK